MKGFVRHFLLTLRLNFRARQALVYGYLVPIFFLIAFGSVFHSSVPPLLHEMGQLVTITILGGACFGMPTGMVSERERGVWRRYKLLPAPLGGLIASTMAARFAIVLLAVIMQFGLAWALYRTPFPARPLELLIAFTAVSFAFLGMGLIIAALANAVPSVQALGQAIFLPMIMIGGVGVPLRALPPWAQKVAAYLPGRYAVEALDACYLPNAPGLAGARFALAALLIIGIAAFIAGAQMFRWDAGQKTTARAKPWLCLALAAWLAVGIAARHTGHTGIPIEEQPGALSSTANIPNRFHAPWMDVTVAQIQAIRFDDLPPDDGDVVPVDPDIKDLTPESKKRLNALSTKLDTWPPANDTDIVQRTRNLLSVAAIFDVNEDSDEGAIGYLILHRIRDEAPPDDVEKILTCIITHPAGGKVLTQTPDLGATGAITEQAARERSVLYAKKLLKILLAQ